MTIRNLGLVIAGLVALYLAIWRGLVAQRQANAAQQSLRNERYQKGAEMLGNEVLSVRLGGIYALQRLAQEYPKEYHVQIMRLFSAFARHPTKDDGHEEEVKAKFGIPQIREDVLAVVHAIGNRDFENVNLERGEEFQLKLENAYMSFASLDQTTLARAHLGEADLSHSSLMGTDLRGIFAIATNFQSASLSLADLSGSLLISSNLNAAVLTGANLSGAWLDNADLTGAVLSGTDFSRVHGLTQAQLDKAVANPDVPPKLDGVMDAKTNQQLFWRGAPLKDDE